MVPSAQGCLFLAVGLQPELEKAHWARETTDFDTAWLVSHVLLCYHEFLPENLGSALMSVASKSLSCLKIQLEIPPEQMSFSHSAFLESFTPSSSPGSICTAERYLTMGCPAHRKSCIV